MASAECVALVPLLCLLLLQLPGAAPTLRPISSRRPFSSPTASPVNINYQTLFFRQKDILGIVPPPPVQEKLGIDDDITISIAETCPSHQSAELDEIPIQQFSAFHLVTYEGMLFGLSKVDHFGFAEDVTFEQRYLLSDKYWNRTGGPILFYAGNEGDIELFCNNTGFMWDVEEELQAMLVFAEHRYYGLSLPFGPDSFADAKHLNYLTSEQALVDFAVLIRSIKDTTTGAKNSPVIAIGGSYGGMLAAWMRMKYPDVVVGAIAGSAPIWQFEDLVPCDSFYVIVTNDFKMSGQGCASSISKSWNAINRLSLSAAGLQWLSNTFHLCNALQSRLEVASFKVWLTETWVNLAMVNYPYAADFLQPLPAWPIQVVCKYLTNDTVGDKQLLKNIFDAANIYYNYTGKTECLNISKVATSSLGERGWSYQACTEMVMPICSKGIQDMFEPESWDFRAYAEECFKMWGVIPRPRWIATEYGGRNISAHSNIVFSNGGLDPWSAGGVLKNVSDTLISIFIPEGAHHLDLRCKNPNDPESVVRARALEIWYMKKWIRNASRSP